MTYSAPIRSGTPTPDTPAAGSSDRPSGRRARRVLVSAAFGEHPGLHPLPAAANASQRWLRAVALGGQGRYAAARAELDRLQRDPRATRIERSLGASTEASLLRQLGGHRAAAVLDGRALELVTARRPLHYETTADDVAARCDALTGLAADALGRGRVRLSIALLTRCSELIDAAERASEDGRFLRQRIRLAWVNAETALATGDFGPARVHAERAVDISVGYGSVRHVVKSELVRAAALTGEADRGPARAVAEEVLFRSSEHGLVPLRWAASMLLDGLGAGPEVRQVRDLCEISIAERGGRFATHAGR